MYSNVAAANELKDIKDVNIDMSMTVDERRKSFLDQIINPYRFKYNDMIISLEFSGETSLEDKILNHFIKK